METIENKIEKKGWEKVISFTKNKVVMPIVLATGLALGASYCGGSSVSGGNEEERTCESLMDHLYCISSSNPRSDLKCFKEEAIQCCEQINLFSSRYASFVNCIYNNNQCGENLMRICSDYLDQNYSQCCHD